LRQSCLGTRGNDQDVFITKGRHFGDQLAFRVEKAASISRKGKGGCTVNVVERSRFCWAKVQKSRLKLKVQRAWISLRWRLNFKAGSFT
jgi:hypothetical protein